MRTRRQQSSGNPMPPREGHQSQVRGQTGHVSVLLHESVEALDIQPHEAVVDATLGGAGHAQVIVRTLGTAGTFVGIDADSAAIERARDALQGVEPRVFLEEANFRDLGNVLDRLSIDYLDKALFDLGWSGFQLSSGRGFSFLKDEPLLMTYSASPSPADITARMVVNDWSEQTLADVIYGWGEERYARKIAHAIVSGREKRPIETSRELAEVVASAVPPAYRRGKTHPATKTFQAIRIAVNDEMGAIREGLSAAWKRMRTRGRIAVITFHSVEDREVKHVLREFAKDGAGVLIPKKPISPSREEIVANPRSRSAKLRVIEKL